MRVTIKQCGLFGKLEDLKIPAALLEHRQRVIQIVLFEAGVHHDTDPGLVTGDHGKDDGESKDPFPKKRLGKILRLG